MKRESRQFRVNFGQVEADRIAHLAAAGKTTPPALIRAIVVAKLFEVRETGKLHLDLGAVDIEAS